ncbi:undecaprenyl-diphosphate phosphatase [Desulfosporosinus acidiphilus]|uniref:undecaprenyl-diphosphate phosphatase n=1 Tax=Desulfosporosinus acidiphilus TaxID=885581 RepID=UPI001FA7A7A2|nr:undecaprenyl-diphosphate phosphatase [Desulfosporosinus acidiphilus]
MTKMLKMMEGLIQVSLIIKAIILGIVEGITEFLPVSSTGHLIIVNEFINFTGNFAKMFDVIIQLGAILSVVVYFWHKLFPFGKHKSRLEKAEIWDIWKKTIVGVLPALFIGAIFGKRIEDKLFTPIVVALALLIGGIILIIIESKNKGGKINSIKQLSFKTALSIGFIQCLAMIPGTSRSAATIIGAMLLGSTRLVAAEFSFFLAIPTMVAASGYSLLKIGFGLTSNEMLLLAIGFVVSFIVALFVISGFMNYISKRDFKLFGYYRIILGILVLVYFSFLK